MNNDKVFKEAVAHVSVAAGNMQTGSIVVPRPYAHALLQALSDLQEERVETLPTYDAGLLSGFGGGNVEWWQDYIRAELGHAHNFYTQFIGNARAPMGHDQARAHSELEPDVGTENPGRTNDSQSRESGKVGGCAPVFTGGAQCRERHVQPRHLDPVGKVETEGCLTAALSTLRVRAETAEAALSQSRLEVERLSYSAFVSHRGKELRCSEAVYQEIRALREVLTELSAELHWDGEFRVYDPDPADDHGPIYLQCPDGLLVNFSCHATPGVDARRVEWVAQALNAALSDKASIPDDKQESGQ